MLNSPLSKILIVVLVSVIGISLYIAKVPVLAGHSVCWDTDSCALSSGLSSIHSPSAALAEFWRPWAGPNRFYRPLLTIEEWLLWSTLPLEHKIQLLFCLQLFLHVEGSVLFMYTLMSARVPDRAAILAASIFGGGGALLEFLSLPTSYEGIIKPFIDLPEPFMLNVVCLSSLAFIRYWKDRSLLNELLCLGSLLFGLLNKETEAVVPIVWLAISFAPGLARWPTSWRQRVMMPLKFGLVILIYGLVRTWVLHGVGAVYATGGIVHRLILSAGGSLTMVVIHGNTLYPAIAFAFLGTLFGITGPKMSRRWKPLTLCLFVCSILTFWYTAASQGYDALDDFLTLGYRVLYTSADTLFIPLSMVLYVLIILSIMRFWQEWPIRLGCVWVGAFTLLWLPMATNLQAEYLIAPGWSIIIGCMIDQVWKASRTPMGTT